jgi:serine/threonine protein kinase
LFLSVFLPLWRALNSSLLLGVQVGEGSYGAVYKALDKTDGMVVAVKVLDVRFFLSLFHASVPDVGGVLLAPQSPFPSGKRSPRFYLITRRLFPPLFPFLLILGPLLGARRQLQNDESETSDLQKEINILKHCHSPYIVAYKGSFAKDGKIWIVMEYCGAGEYATFRFRAALKGVSVVAHVGLTFVHAAVDRFFVGFNGHLRRRAGRDADSRCDEAVLAWIVVSA